MRLEHWLKNSFVFVALVFSGSFTKFEKYPPVFWTFLAFCLCASGAYLINDVLDFKNDRLHPAKKSRPVAAGTLSRPLAFMGGILLTGGGIGVAAFVNLKTFQAVVLYCAITFFYSVFLKKIPILDCGAIAAGFVLRAYAGATAIHVFPSPWLILCAFLLAAYLALCKRLCELELLGENSNQHRRTLGLYTRKHLLGLIFICAALNVIVYTIYTLQPSTVRQVNGPGLVLTLPFVIYGILRYFHLAVKHNTGGRPVEVFLTDWRILGAVTAWIISSGLIIFFHW